MLISGPRGQKALDVPVFLSRSSCTQSTLLKALSAPMEIDESACPGTALNLGNVHVRRRICWIACPIYLEETV